MSPPRRSAVEIDTHYANRMILADVNLVAYRCTGPTFGDGDEGHSAFHFPLMPLHLHGASPGRPLLITDIIKQTPEIPETCQWGLFLRNHDELTLEMVTNDERDYMYLAYSADPRHAAQPRNPADVRRHWWTTTFAGSSC